MSANLTPARLATAAIFLLCGIGMSSWAPMVPFAKVRLGLNDADLGLILLALGGGAMVTMPLTGVFINRFGSRTVLLFSSLTICALLPLLTLAPSAVLLAVALFCFGAGVGATDVAMNAQAVVVEQKMGKTIMSSLHGLYSVGGLVGAAAISFLLVRGLPLPLAALIMTGLNLLLLFAAFRYLLPANQDARIEGGKFVWPHGPVLVIGMLCFIAFLAEGALLDWSAVFLRFERGFAEADAGIGYALFSATMAFGRLTGDWVSRAWGPRRTLAIGALIAAVGYGVAIGVPSGTATLTGFAIIGLGIANVVPVFFSAVGRLDSPPPAVSIPAITTLGYAGMLVGPAVIGFVGELTSLSLALGMISLALIGVAASARIVPR